MSNALITDFEQRRQEYQAAQRRLSEARRLHSMYQRQARGAGLSELEQAQYCAQALASVAAGIKAVDEATAALEAAYGAIPAAERPVVEYWS